MASFFLFTAYIYFELQYNNNANAINANSSTFNYSNKILSATSITFDLQISLFCYCHLFHFFKINILYFFSLLKIIFLFLLLISTLFLSL